MKNNKIDFDKQPLFIVCDCGEEIHINPSNLHEMAAGVWGTINCPKCGFRLNDKIAALEDKSLIKSK